MYPKGKVGYQLQFTIEGSGIYFPDEIEIPQIYVQVYKEKIFIAEDPLYSERLTEEQNWIIIGKTEVLKNTSDPKLRKIFKLDCIEDEKLNLKFEIIENNIQAELGHTLIQAQELLNHSNRKILDIKNVGQLIIVCDKIPTPNQRIQLQLRANIKQIMCFCTSMKTYLKIYRVHSNGTTFLAHQTQPFISNQPLFDIDIPNLIEDQMEISIIEFQGTILDIISQSLKQLKQGIVAFKGKCKRVNFIVESFKVQNYPSFNCLVDKGLKLKLMVGIDYSSRETKLNSIQQLLLYIQALKKLIPFLMQFSSSQNLQAYGMGAKQCNFLDWIDDKPYDLFPLSGVYNQVEVGSDKIVNQYQDTFNQLECNGSVNYCPLLIQFLKQAINSNENNDQQFNILVILSSNIKPDDLNDFLILLQKANKLPLCIIIIGTGNSKDFLKLQRQIEKKSQNLSGRRDLILFIDPKKPYISLKREVAKWLPLQINQYLEISNQLN